MKNLMAIKIFRKLATEKDHLNQCLAYMTKLKFFVWRNNSGFGKYQNKDGSTRYVKFGFNGMPDILGFIPVTNSYNKTTRAIPVYWEVKKIGGKASNSQRQFISIAQESGCFAGIGTFDDLVEKLKVLRGSKK